MIKLHVNEILSCLNEDIPANQEDEYGFVSLSEANLSVASVTTWESKMHSNHVIRQLCRGSDEKLQVKRPPPTKPLLNRFTICSECHYSFPCQ